ncbi:MAG TPA: SMP-30/gluconolactonase/LRE family protein [Saprospiraceae bacterium]|nr:SMP-30/gluconolactonase/LRE family protein [Saprospiraceae bacterium]
MTIKSIFTFPLLLSLLFATIATAHPGSGIVVDANGQVYFTDTGKGVWKIDTQHKLTFMPASRFHWMTLDPMGCFAESQKSFGGYFERVTSQSSIPALVICSDFPLVVNTDGNMYYAHTRPGATNIIRRTTDGRESTLANNAIFEFVNGITTGTDGSLYITESSNPHANTIRKITMNGTVSILATFVGKDGKDLPLETVPSYCRGLAVDASGTIYVAATGSRSVLKITPEGQVTTILQESSPWTPTGVAVFQGEVFVLEWHDVTSENLEVRTAWIPRVRKIGLDGKVTTLATVSRTK